VPDRRTSSTAFSQGGKVALICALVLVALAPLIRSAHRHTDAWAPRHDVTDEIKYMPTGSSLKAASLGYEMLVADLLWARTTMLFGEKYEQTDRDWYAWIFHMIDLATDLDPEFKAAYKYGGTMLRVDGVFIDQSSLIFQKGMHGRPDEWFYPWAIAMNYFMFKDDRETAAHYMALAAERGADDGPWYLPSLAASLMSEAGDLESSLMFLQEEINNLPPDQEARRRAVEVKIFELKYRIACRDAQRVVDEFRRRAGALPPDPPDVGSVGLTLPADPLAGTWEWDQDPAAELGTVRSSEYCSVFGALARETGLGREVPLGCYAAGPALDAP
jgi:hypothetical protein